MTYYIGIDQSFSSTGFVVLDRNCLLITHEVFTSLKLDGDYFKRSKIVAESVANKIHSLDGYYDGDLQIALEGLAFGMRGHTLQNLAGLQFMIVNAIRDLNFDVSIYTPSNVKKTATGKGRADKNEMFEYLPNNIKKIFSRITKSNGREDLTDAYWIARLLWSQDTGM